MGEFLNESNPCGQKVLSLVSRGNAIIAEILRLKEYVPSIYRLETKSDQQKYGELLLDFSFFKKMEEFEKRLEASEWLRELDEEVRENELELVTRFYLLFESIHKYMVDVNTLVHDLKHGHFIQQNMETVFSSHEGKQLMCEALYLGGVMLLMVDVHIEGIVRERLLVSYFRYSAARASADCYVDDVCRLLCTTGTPAARHPNYPHNYFKRAGMDPEYVSLVVGRLRADDVYHQLKVFPLPEHRSTALATQAGMLIVSLYFIPELLHSHTAAMREIVDKFFPDNWVVSIYMGETVNLVQAWDQYKAAKSALGNTIASQNVESVAGRARDQLHVLLPQMKRLNEERISESYLLDNCHKMLTVIREANVTLRWLLLHTAPLPAGGIVASERKPRQLRELVLGICKQDPAGGAALMLALFNMLLHTAQLELHVRDTINKMVEGKGERWREEKAGCVERMRELADMCVAEAGASRATTRLQPTAKLHAWFSDMGTQIASLDPERATVAGTKIVHLIRALEEVQEFHGLCSSGHAVQLLEESRRSLHGLLRSAGLQEDMSVQLQVIGDMSYGWRVVHHFTQHMQDGIRADTGLVTKLRATFLKMASALEVPLLRINQARSKDLVSVSQYYSSELVALLRHVLRVIPQTMFHTMASIAALQTDVIKEMPTRLDKDDIKELAQLKHRAQVAKLTNEVSTLTEGMSVLRRTLVGVIRIDPVQLLEDGIRCELVTHMATALHHPLIFNPKNKETDLEGRLEKLGEVMEGHKRSFEYIQDYVHIYGLKLWQEELSRIIGCYVEQECNAFVRHKVSDAQSVYQSKAVPIPTLTTPLSTSNCIGRLVHEILRITDPRTAVCAESGMAWLDQKDHTELLGLHFFHKLSRAVGVPGLLGVDHLMSFMVVNELQTLLTAWQRGSRQPDVTELMGGIAKLLAASPLIENGGKVFSAMVSRCARVSQIQAVTDQLLRVGHLQLLRNHIAYQLNESCDLESPHLSHALHTLNQSILSDVSKHFRDGSCEHPPPDLLYHVTSLLDGIGMSQPASKIYVTASHVRYLALVTFIITITNLSKLVLLDGSAGVGLTKKGGERLDGRSVVMGVHTLLRQVHPEVRTQYLTYMTQYAKSRALTRGSGGEEAMVVRVLAMMEQLSGGGSSGTSNLPPHIAHLLTLTSS